MGSDHSFSYHTGIALKHEGACDYLGFLKGIVFSDERTRSKSNVDDESAVEEDNNNRKISVPCLDLNLSQNASTVSSLLSSPASEIDDGKNNNNGNMRAHRRGENTTITK